jgi:molybdopterin biosynthesis enzyme
MSAPDKHPTRVQVEVDGYAWRIHGAKAGQRFHCHLVELVGPLPLDGPVTQPLRDKIRAALAKALALDECEIARITADLILA